MSEVIPESAVEAAAEALALIADPWGKWGDQTASYHRGYRRQVASILEAAAPHLLAEDRAKVWDEALEAGEHWCRDLNPSEIANPYRPTP